MFKLWKFYFIIATTLFTTTSIFAEKISVNTSENIMNTMKNASAGDTVIIAPGTYIGNPDKSGDPGNLPTGKGCFWIGNNGTKENPIVIISEQEDNPAILQGNSITSNYVIHITGNYVVLKNLIIRKGDKIVVFDHSSFSILEDCEIYNSGSELVHVRDSSCNVTISRNHIYSSGNGDERGTFGEGIYIGTDQARWGADDVPQSQWGDKAVSEGYGGYDWRVHNTKVICNYIGGGISAECLDIKEGTQNTLVDGNMLVGDSIGLKSGARSYDDSFIDMKGVKGTFINNMFYRGTNSINKYIAEIKRSYPHIPDSLTVDSNSDPWCDDSKNDENNGSVSKNSVVTKITDPRNNCSPFFDFNWNNTNILTTKENNRNQPIVSLLKINKEAIFLYTSISPTDKNINIDLFNIIGQKIYSIPNSNITLDSHKLHIVYSRLTQTSTIYYLRIKTNGQYYTICIPHIN